MSKKNNGKNVDIVVKLLILSYFFIIIILNNCLIDCSILFNNNGIKNIDIDF